MQKLDEIRRAEDAASHAVVLARGRADEMLKNADTEASRIVEAAKADAANRAAAIRDEALGVARSEADRIARESADEIAEVTARAKTRFEDAVSAVVAAVTE